MFSPIDRRLAVGSLAIAVALGLAVRLAQSAPPSPAKARTDAAAKAYAAHEAQHGVGMDKAESVYLWSVRWLESEGGVTVSAAVEEHRKRMIALETSVTAKVKAGAAGNAELADVQYYRAEAEVWSTKAKGGKP